MTQPKILYKLFESRIIGEHKEEFALSRLVGPLEERQPDIIEAGKSIYKVHIAPYSNDKPYVTDATTRKESIQKGIPTWGAAGFLPLVAYEPEDIHLALLYRDAKAPSWPDHYTLPSGLSHLIDNVPEPVYETALRELREELIFLDKRNTDKGLFKEIDVPFGIYFDGKTKVEVYENEKLVDFAQPFAIGWGTPMDTATTVIYLCTMFPNRVIDNAKENLQVINGEIVDREVGRIFSRTTVLANFLDVYEKRPKIRVRRFSVNLDEDRVDEEYLEVSEIKYLNFLRLAVGKLQSLKPEELSDLLKL